MYRTGTGGNGASIDKNTSVAGEERSVCFICAAEHPPLWAVYECSHRVCSLCCLRMRELYGSNRCAWCKVASPRAIIVRAVLQADGTDHTSSYGELSERAIVSDATRGLLFPDVSVQHDVMLCLQAHCPRCSLSSPVAKGRGSKIGGSGRGPKGSAHPNASADPIGPQPPSFANKTELKRHMQQVHDLMACDICLVHRKCFPYELHWYRPGELLRHQRESPPGGHPACNLCSTLFYSEDELTEHCRERHENCFICQRRAAGRPAYFRDYDELEGHFRREHWLCPDPSCLDLKFVVFENELEYKAHQAEMHLAHVRMQRSTQNQFRRLDTGFQVVSSSSSAARRGEGGRTRDRDEHHRSHIRAGEREEEPTRQDDTMMMTRTEGGLGLGRGGGSTLAPSSAPPSATLSKATARNLIFGEAIGELASRLQSLSLYEQRNVELAQTLTRDHGLSEGQLGSLKGHCRLYQRGQLDAASLTLKLEGVLGAKGLEVIGPIIIDLELDTGKRLALEGAIRAHLRRLTEFPALPEVHGASTGGSGTKRDGPRAGVSPSPPIVTKASTMNFARRVGAASAALSSSSTTSVAPVPLKHMPVATIRIKPAPTSVPSPYYYGMATVDPAKNPLALLGAVRSTAALSASSSLYGSSTGAAAGSRKKQPAPLPSYLQAVASSSSVGITRSASSGEAEYGHQASLDETNFPHLAEGKRKAAIPSSSAFSSVFARGGQSTEPASFVIGDHSGQEAYEDRKDELMMSGLNQQTGATGESTTERGEGANAKGRKKGSKGTVLLRYG